MSCYAVSASGSRSNFVSSRNPRCSNENPGEPDAASANEKPHLHARQLDDVIVSQPGSLSANGCAIEQRIVVNLAAVDMDDEVAFRPASDRRDLNTWTAQRSQSFVQLELATRERTREHLQLRLFERSGGGG